ncbi:uncharacterized protein LOC142326585 [Lycorma delicatula]|uniref:uncharacterized protein LOC142326585 n=1 Tax=Lycorma delicatula TaxID=130591 RepID=UPI003F5127DA
MTYDRNIGSCLAYWKCVLRLWQESGNLTWNSLPVTRSNDCKVLFPRDSGLIGGIQGPGLVVRLTRLNVPCSAGKLQFISGKNTVRHLCGKLEEISPSSRLLYFPSGIKPYLLVEGRPIFVIDYKFVDYCYNITLTGRNGSFDVVPKLKSPTGLHCNYQILLPYGYRASINLYVGEGNTLNEPSRLAVQTIRPESADPVCKGLMVRLWDGPTSWFYCSNSGDTLRELSVLSRENRVSIRVTSSPLSDSIQLRLWYETVPVAELVQECEFGWIAIRHYCVIAIDDRKLPWRAAEEDCVRLGGHLASIRNEHAQRVIDNLLIHSPGYRDQNSYWVGASDVLVEGDFRWSDGFPFTYSNWFPGYGRMNRQPNDDGLSEQDCVELRRMYHLPGTTPQAPLTSSFMWNDRDCTTPNYFVCEKLIQPEVEIPVNGWECNRTIILSLEQPRAVVTSPAFPNSYPDNVDCHTLILCPPSHRILIEFDELVLEKEPLCGYDVLELWEDDEQTASRRYCGDLTDRLKLLRYKTEVPKLRLRFYSDYSHHMGGFKARVSMEHVSAECPDDRLHMFNNSCYLFASYPQVTWQTAKQICEEMKAELSSVHSIDEEQFIVSKIRESRDYNTGSIYWLGAHSSDPDLDLWSWVDNSPMSYTAWLSTPSNVETSCLSLQWMTTPTQLLPSGLYWQPQDCSTIGGYVCKRENQGSGLNLNGTVNGTEGRLTSPGFPAPYYHNLDYWVHLLAPESTRIVVHFTRLDLEPQNHCLYDYIVLQSTADQIESTEPPTTRLCGHYDASEMERKNFVSESNEAIVRFHSDYSVSGGGFSLTWHSVDVSGCPLQTLTAKEGVITSPNYPYFLLSHLDCSTTILAPAGRRVWLEITNFEMDPPDSILELSLGGDTELIQPFRQPSHLSDGVFVSVGERLQVRLKTGDMPKGKGFRAIYKTVNSVHENRVVDLHNESSGFLYWVNYPLPPAPALDFTDHLIAPLGKAIHLHFFRAIPSHWDEVNGKSTCDGRGEIEVHDSYADFSSNGTWWRLCEATSDAEVPPLAINSYLNTLHIRQKNSLSNKSGVRINVSISIEPDLNYKVKLLQVPTEGAVESCKPNPCLNGGKCASGSNKKSCQCIGHYTGMFCALTLCELEPCMHGRCELTPTGFTCHCQRGWVGDACDTKQKPCADNPCEGRGDCIPRSETSFHCRCHAWWEGPRCERRLMYIPYKPLSERMLQEPFWLGLITVTVVLGVLGLFWCAKRHFPEKLEKLLAEEADRNRHCMSTGRTPSVREQLAGPLYSSSQLAVPAGSGAGGGGTGGGSGGPPRSLFGRLGIRKPSLLSLTSPLVPPAPTQTARTFSLDDLLKQPPGRTPSPRKKRNNSTPVKKNAAVEKKQILQQLVSPANRKLSLDEVVALATNKVQGEMSTDERAAETTFTTPAQLAEQQSKLEKKVTFARLLDKVSSEMSSGSEMESTVCGAVGMTLAVDSNAEAPSTLPSDPRSPHSTSSNQGSDSLSSSEVTLALNSGDIAKRPARLLLGPKKTNSADSILAMFRNFASTSTTGVGFGSSNLASPSTTPTASSPQDELAGSDESSTATPISTSSAAESPPFFARKHTIQVSVLDPLSAQKTASNSSSSNLLHPPTILLEVPNKCLSPIREVPTPSPSPALSPIMPRHQMSSSVSSYSSSTHLLVPGQQFFKTGKSGQNVGNNSASHDDNGVDSTANTLPCTISLSTPIPTVTIQESSPTHPEPLTLGVPGSPPPHKEKPSNRGKFLKEFDKPTSLDLPVPPPVITVTCSMSEAESDSESPANKSGVGNSGGMCYLSPFSMCSRADRTASESNLSSSGYSSMASPGPSRCGSNNPLCPPDSESDHHQPTRRPSPLIRTPGNDDGGRSGGCHHRGRSDSETLSDDPQLESNDEGFGTDHLEEKIEDGILKSAKELEVFIGSELLDSGQTLLGSPSPPSQQTYIRHCGSVESDLENCKNLLVPLHNVKHCASVEAGLDCYRLMVPTNDKVRQCGSVGDSLDNSRHYKVTLQLPSIVVDPDPGGNDIHCSPVSSRSESPLSDKTAGLGRFSPMFYGKLTDSDGLYDCASSDCCKIVPSSRRSSGRRKERRRSKSPKNVTKDSITQVLLDVPSKAQVEQSRHNTRNKPSPKRRARTQQQPPISSTTSSSSESLNSIRDMTLCLSSTEKSPDRLSWQGLPDTTWSKDNKNIPSNEASGEDTGEDGRSEMLAKSSLSGLKVTGSDDPTKGQRKISRIRTIGHQIRFLRRLEQSLKQREMEQSSVTTPLLVQTGSNPCMRRSHSGGRLARLTRHRATVSDEPLLPPEERSWRRVTITGNGHTD